MQELVCGDRVTYYVGAIDWKESKAASLDADIYENDLSLLEGGMLQPACLCLQQYLPVVCLPILQIHMLTQHLPKLDIYAACRSYWSVQEDPEAH